MLLAATASALPVFASAAGSDDAPPCIADCDTIDNGCEGLTKCDTSLCDNQTKAMISTHIQGGCQDDSGSGDGGGNSMPDSSNELDSLDIKFDGYDAKTAYEFYDEVTNDAVATHGADQTFCKVGLSTKMGGNMLEMIHKENPDMKGAMKAIKDVIKPVKVPCGSAIDMSAGIIEAAGAMGFDPKASPKRVRGTLRGKTKSLNHPALTPHHAPLPLP